MNRGKNFKQKYCLQDIIDAALLEQQTEQQQSSEQQEEKKIILHLDDITSEDESEEEEESTNNITKHAAKKKRENHHAESQKRKRECRHEEYEEERRHPTSTNKLNNSKKTTDLKRPHIFKKCVHYSLGSIQALILNIEPTTWTCACDVSSDVWMCLTCGAVGCSRDKNKHALKHYEETKHPFAICLNTKHCWCFACDEWVTEDNHLIQ